MLKIDFISGIKNVNNDVLQKTKLLRKTSSSRNNKIGLMSC